jgi:hypothetical protein
VNEIMLLLLRVVKLRLAEASGRANARWSIVASGVGVLDVADADLGVQAFGSALVV